MKSGKALLAVATAAAAVGAAVYAKRKIKQAANPLKKQQAVKKRIVVSGSDEQRQREVIQGKIDKARQEMPLIFEEEPLKEQGVSFEKVFDRFNRLEKPTETATTETETPIEMEQEEAVEAEAPVEEERETTAEAESPIQNEQSVSIENVFDCFNRLEKPTETATTEAKTPIEMEQEEAVEAEAPFEEERETTAEAEASVEMEQEETAEMEAPVEEQEATAEAEAPVEEERETTAEAESPIQNEQSVSIENVFDCFNRLEKPTETATTEAKTPIEMEQEVATVEAEMSVETEQEEAVEAEAPVEEEQEATAEAEASVEEERETTAEAESPIQNEQSVSIENVFDCFNRLEKPTETAATEAKTPIEMEQEEAVEAEAPVEEEQEATAEAEASVEMEQEETAEMEAPVEEQEATAEAEAPVEEQEATAEAESPIQNEQSVSIENVFDRFNRLEKPTETATTEAETPIEMEQEVATVEAEMPVETEQEEAVEAEAPVEEEQETTAEAEMPVETEQEEAVEAEAPFEEERETTAEAESPIQNEQSVSIENVFDRFNRLEKPTETATTEAETPIEMEQEVATVEAEMSVETEQEEAVEAEAPVETEQEVATVEAKMSVEAEQKTEAPESEPDGEILARIASAHAEQLTQNGIRILEQMVIVPEPPKNQQIDELKEAPEEEAKTEQAPEEEAKTEQAPEEEAKAEQAPEEEAKAEEAPEEEANTEQAPPARTMDFFDFPDDMPEEPEEPPITDDEGVSIEALFGELSKSEEKQPEITTPSEVFSLFADHTGEDDFDKYSDEKIEAERQKLKTTDLRRIIAQDVCDNILSFAKLLEPMYSVRENKIKGKSNILFDWEMQIQSLAGDAPIKSYWRNNFRNYEIWDDDKCMEKAGELLSVLEVGGIVRDTAKEVVISADTMNFYGAQSEHLNNDFHNGETAVIVRPCWKMNGKPVVKGEIIKKAPFEEFKRKKVSPLESMLRENRCEDGDVNIPVTADNFCTYDKGVQYVDNAIATGLCKCAVRRMDDGGALVFFYEVVAEGESDHYPACTLRYEAMLDKNGKLIGRFRSEKI